ncbi:MAG: fructose-6-phosphate aldolase [Bacillota bacterium]
MRFFVDTANVDEIREAYSWGVVDGVTTNPTHIAASGRRFLDVVEEICSIVEGPISVEVASTDAEGMVREARDLVKIHENIVVKIPLVKEGIKAIKVLSSEGIKTNATLNFSAAQALMAAKVGATYVSPFVGRLDNTGHFGMELVRQIRQIYVNYGFKTEIIVAAVRHPAHVLEAALAGADVTTMRFEIMKALFDHPMTELGLEQFLRDWEKVPK